MSWPWPKGGLPHGEHPHDYGYDEVVVLPSGTELSVEAALGDLARIRQELLNETENDAYPVDFSGEAADLGHVAELIEVLAGRASAGELVVGDIARVVVPIEMLGSGRVLDVGARVVVSVAVAWSPGVGVEWTDDDGTHVMAVSRAKLEKVP